MARRTGQPGGLEISSSGATVHGTAGPAAVRRVGRAFGLIRLRLARGRVGLLMLLCGCLVVAAGLCAGGWVGRYRLSAELLAEYPPLRLPEELFLSWLACRIIVLLSVVLVLAGVICCLVGIVKAVRGRSAWSGRRRPPAGRSRRVEARVIRSAKSRMRLARRLVAAGRTRRPADSDA